MVYDTKHLDSDIPIRRVIISCYDKTNLSDFVSELSKESNFEIISSGGTRKYLLKHGFQVTPVDSITSLPEMPGGLVKTLHPRVFAGILAEIDTNDDKNEMNSDQKTFLKEFEINTIDLIICNLYPFSETVKSGGDIESCRSQIDIGGPSLIRAAAKNFPRIAVVTSPNQYLEFIEKIKKNNGKLSLNVRFDLAKKAFEHTKEYDKQINEYLSNQKFDSVKSFYLKK